MTKKRKGVRTHIEDPEQAAHGHGMIANSPIGN